MNPPAVGDPTGDAGPVSFTLHGGDIAPEPTGSSRVSSGKKMPKVFAGWRFVLAPPPLPSLRLDRPARRSVTFEQELEPGMDVLREQTPEPSGFDSDEADSRAQRRSSGSGRDRRRRRKKDRGPSPPWWLNADGLAPYFDRIRGAPMIRLTREIRGEGLRLFGKGPLPARDGAINSPDQKPAANNAESEGGGIFRRSQVRVHACPDVALGWRGVLAGGEHDDDPVAIELDVQSALVPSGGRLRHTAGLHIRAKILPRWFPNDRLEAGVSVEAYAERSEPGGVGGGGGGRKARRETKRRERERQRERERVRVREDGSDPGGIRRRADVRDSPGVPGARPMFTFGMGRGETLTRSSSRRDTNRHDTNRHDEVDDGSSDDDGEIDAAALAAAAATVVNSINGTPLPAEPDRYDDRYNKRSSRKQLFNDTGDDTNDKASANEFTVRRRDTWWARVRVWRGVYVKVGTRLKTTPEGRITFASPLAELQCEFDEDDDDGTHSRNYWKSPDGRPVTKDEDAVYAESVSRQMTRERATAEREKRREVNDAAKRLRREDAARRARETKEARVERRRMEAEYREDARRREALSKDLRRRAKLEREAESAKLRAERKRAEAAEEEAKKAAADDAAARAKRDAERAAADAVAKEEAATRAAAAIVTAAATDQSPPDQAPPPDESPPAAEVSAPVPDADTTQPSKDVGVLEVPAASSSTPPKPPRPMPPRESEPDDFEATAAAEKTAIVSTPPLLPRPPPPPTADELKRLEREAKAARKLAEKAAQTERRRTEDAAKAARREKVRLDKLAEEEKDARSKAEAEDIAAQARRALEEKKRREAERVAAEKEAKAAEKEARRREARERREADAVARMAIRNEENERKIADAARRRAENEIRELENAAAALEADAEREARRARDAEMREAARALKEAETESKRMAAELESSAPKQPATSSTTTVVQPPSERVTELPSRLARAALTKTDDLPSDDDDLPQGGSGLDPARTVAIVPGHWIDPGFDGEEGPPGERALNLVIANRAHALLGDDGWTVLRPDLAVPPLAREQYVAWVKTQSSAGVAVLEVHGRSGTDEDELSSGVKHTRTGVISQDDSVLGAELAKSFGTAQDGTWRELAVPRCGGAVLESFDSSTLEAMDAAERSETVDGIARDIAAAVSATAVVTPPEGCSVSGCSRWREDD